LFRPFFQINPLASAPGIQDTLSPQTNNPDSSYEQQRKTPMEILHRRRI
jgi:hypothetical protein